MNSFFYHQSPVFYLKIPFFFFKLMCLFVDRSLFPKTAWIFPNKEKFRDKKEKENPVITSPLLRRSRSDRYMLL